MTERDDASAADAASQIARWADRLRAIARTGLHYSTDPYNRERYARLEELAAEMLGTVLGQEPSALLATWERETGYVTPKVGLVAAIHDEKGRVLLIQRPDSLNWSLPAGFAEVGESPATGITREVAEETGLVVVPRRLLGLYDAWLHGSENPHHIYTIAFVCEARGGTLARTPEALDVGYFDLETLPAPISKSHRRAIEDALTSWGEPGVAAWFDPL